MKRMNMKTIIPTLAALAGLGFNGCGSEELANAVFQQELLGTWVQSDCTDHTTASSKTTLIFAGTTITSTTAVYAGVTDCTGDVYQTTSQTTTVSGGVAVTTPSGAKTMDQVVSAVTLAPNTDAATAAFIAAESGGGYCGITDWATNVASDVAGKTCTADGADPSVQVSVGYTTYDIYQITGTSLQLGTAPAATSSDSRTTTLGSTTYTKQ